jgi:hypothetical protein
METITFWLIWGALGVGMLIYYCRRQHPVRSLLWGTLTGLTGLLLLHYCGTWIGFTPAISLFHLMQAGILGIPGVIMMTVLHFVL